jgi:hypothetical protein
MNKDEKIPPNNIRVTAKGIPNKYLAYGIRLFEDDHLDSVTILGSG